jgi:hypothetical protein
VAELTEAGARRVLQTYARSRPLVEDAVRVLKNNGATIAEIVRLSGLSRSGVEKILARHEATA